MKQRQAHYCFQQAEEDSHTHMLYIYDDVSEYGTFDWWTWKYTESETSAEFFRKALAEIPETDTIELHINSYGGSVKEGVAIYNQLKQKKCKKIVAYVDGFAYSIASVIMQAADERIMGLGTSLLIHNMWLQVAGNAEDLRKAADDLDVLMESNRQIYLERINISEEELIDLMNNESYLTPDQAVEMGFADSIDSKKTADPDVTISQMQQSLTQMRRLIAEQKSFRTELLEFCKNAKQEDKKDDEDDKDDQTDDDQNTDDENTDDQNEDDDQKDDEDDKKQKDHKDSKQRLNTNSLAVLLAQAATKNLKK